MRQASSKDSSNLLIMQLQSMAGLRDMPPLQCTSIFSFLYIAFSMKTATSLKNGNILTSTLSFTSITKCRQDSPNAATLYLRFSFQYDFLSIIVSTALMFLVYTSWSLTASFPPRNTFPVQKQLFCSPQQSETGWPMLKIRSNLFPLCTLGSSSISKNYNCPLPHSQIYHMIKTVLFAFWIAAASCALTYNKVVLDDPQAKCLDGSPGAYYIWQGNPEKVLIFMEGGGWCGDNDLASTTENCYQRSKTDLGSSTGYQPTHTFAQGILSNQADNYFKGWTRVFLKYCDGSGHQGTRSDALLYKGAQLFFRGQNITLAQFQSINKSNKIFTQAVTQLVLSGQSAGGLATFHWTNYLASKLAKQTKFWSIPDSGVFIDETNSLTKVNSYRLCFQNLLKLSNEEVGTPIPECNRLYPNQLWKCMFAQYIHPFISVPLFAPQSLYDSWSIYNILGIRCLDGNSIARCSQQDQGLIESYRQSTLQVMFEISSRNQNGVWAPVCINHCYLSNDYYSSPNYRIPQKSEYSLIRSVQYWIESSDENPRHIDFGSWPLNAPCSGVTLSME